MNARTGFLCIVMALTLSGQGFESYRIDTLYGRFPRGNGGSPQEALLAFPNDIVIDRDGTIYLADTLNCQVRRVSADGSRIDVVAGTGIPGNSGDGGPAAQARLDNPISLAIDRENGWLYIGCEACARIRRVNVRAANPVISAFAGTGQLGYGGDGGPALAARIGGVEGMVVDSRGNVIFSDTDNHRVRRVDISTNTIQTIAGTGVRGGDGDNGPATAARFAFPFGLAIDSRDFLYIADTFNHRIRRVNPNTGILEAIAGLSEGMVDNLPPKEAKFSYPDAIAIDEQRQILYVADDLNNRVRRVPLTASGIVTTIAGTGNAESGPDGGPGVQTAVNRPMGVAVAANGDVLFVESFGHRVRKINILSGNISTPIGRRPYSPDAAPASGAVLFWPGDIVEDGGGSLYVAETANYIVRRIDRNGTLSTVAGMVGLFGSSGDDGPARQARLGNVYGIAADPLSRRIWIADFEGNRVRQVNLDSGQISTVVNGVLGPVGLVYDPERQDLYVAEQNGHRVIVQNLASGARRLVAGRGVAGFAGDGGTGLSALVDSPHGLALDRNGNLFIADRGNHRIRMVDRAGAISTIAGNGSSEVVDGDRPPLEYNLPFPRHLSVDAAGNVYVMSANRVIQITAARDRAGRMAGSPSGAFGDTGDGGPAPAAEFNGALAVRALLDGRIIVADTQNNRIRVISQAASMRLRIASGDNQSILVGQVGQPLVVQVTNDIGGPVNAVEVRFEVTRGSATLSATRVMTRSDGTAQTFLTMSSTPGSVSVTAVVTGLPPVTFNLTATPSAPPPAGGPRINTGGVVSAGLSTPALRTLSPGQIFSVFGEGFLAAGTAGRRVQAEEIVGGRLPTNLLAVCVEVNGTSAPVFDVFPGQVNAILPALPPGTAEVKVLKDCGRSTQVVSNAESVPVAARAPEFLYAAFAPGGGNPVAAISATSGEYIGPPNLGPAFRPARPGEIVSAFGVGFGMTSPEVMPGTTIPTVAPVMGRLAVLLGGIPLARADILYVGLAPGFYGLYQVNFRVPETTPVGDQSLVIAVDDISSPVSGRLSIAR